MTVAQQFAKNLLSFSQQPFSELAREQARIAIIDTLGVTLAGAVQEEAGKLRSVITLSAAKGNSRVFGTDLRLNPLDAALLNGTAAHLLDFDDSNSWLHGHISVAVLPALLALADDRNLNGDAIIRAYLTGYETAVRMGKAVSPFQYRHGWHPTTTVGIFAGVAAAAVLVGLSEQQTATALSICTSLASGIKSNFGSETKALGVGQAARSAVLAVLLAEADFSAGKTAFEHHHGYFNVFNGSANADALPLTESWEGKVHILDTEKSNNFKYFSCCYAILSPVDGVLELRKQTELQAEEIARIEVQVHPIRFPHINIPQPENPLAGKFSLHYCVARAFVTGTLTLDDFVDNARFSDPQTQALMNKVTLTTHQDTVTHTAYVTLTTTDGQQFHQSVAGALGSSPSRPLPEGVLVEKFFDCATRALPLEAAKSLYQRLLQDDYR
ncbi:MmgE/PrpD family protein [Klebsiella sp. BIGb0407]|uniref:MmgE/PrpD family protein n=1 Tax=Klebsiella sp. BIGb0407 TaxID=2940603 RepID=UPI0021672296|nr:MmgE/PrpD family protein [Klebsiella sp. BIGb0407]MCS3432269.1 2-methylcitrate dehydratase PrpD [Klebsiella sp. BIGb0407]